MKKFVIKDSFEGAKITGNIGVIILDEKTTQKDLKKLYTAGYTNIVEVVEKDEPKEEA